MGLEHHPKCHKHSNTCMSLSSALHIVKKLNYRTAQGYSHGSLIASLYPLLSDSNSIKISHILLSYPLGPRSWLTAFRSKHYTTTLNALVRDPRANVLVIYSDCDEFTSIGSYDAWAESLRREAGHGTGKLEVVRVENANHFWAQDAAREKMLRAVQEWLP